MIALAIAPLLGLFIGSSHLYQLIGHLNILRKKYRKKHQIAIIIYRVAKTIGPNLFYANLMQISILSLGYICDIPVINVFVSISILSLVFIHLSLMSAFLSYMHIEFRNLKFENSCWCCSGCCPSSLVRYLVVYDDNQGQFTLQRRDTMRQGLLKNDHTNSNAKDSSIKIDTIQTDSFIQVDNQTHFTDTHVHLDSFANDNNSSHLDDCINANNCVNAGTFVKSADKQTSKEHETIVTETDNFIKANQNETGDTNSNKMGEEYVQNESIESCQFDGVEIKGRDKNIVYPTATNVDPSLIAKYENANKYLTENNKNMNINSKANYENTYSSSNGIYINTSDPNYYFISETIENDNTHNSSSNDQFLKNYECRTKLVSNTNRIDSFGAINYIESADEVKDDFEDNQKIDSKSQEVADANSNQQSINSDNDSDLKKEAHSNKLSESNGDINEHDSPENSKNMINIANDDCVNHLTNTINTQISDECDKINENIFNNKYSNDDCVNHLTNIINTEINNEYGNLPEDSINDTDNSGCIGHLTDIINAQNRDECDKLPEILIDDKRNNKKEPNTGFTVGKPTKTKSSSRWNIGQRCCNQRVVDQLSRVIFGPYFIVVTFFLFLTWWFVLVAFVPDIEIGLDQNQALPVDSYLQQYFRDALYLTRTGAPVYFIIRDGYHYEMEDKQNILCSAEGCSKYSLTAQIWSNARVKDVTYISSGSNSWIDSYFSWLRPNGDPGCCRRVKYVVLNKNLDSETVKKMVKSSLENAKNRDAFISEAVEYTIEANPYRREVYNYYFKSPQLDYKTYLEEYGPFTWSGFVFRSDIYRNINDHFRFNHSYENLLTDLFTNKFPHLSSTDFYGIDNHTEILYPKYAIFCSSQMSKDEDQIFCEPCLDSKTQSDGRPNSYQFGLYLPWFLNDVPNSSCPVGGKASYATNVKLNKQYYWKEENSRLPDNIYWEYRSKKYNINEIVDETPNAVKYEHSPILTSSFMTYHTAMRTPNEFITAIRHANRIARNISRTIEHPVFAYSVFYGYFEAYLEIDNTTATLFGATTLVTFICSLLALNWNIKLSIMTTLIIMTNSLSNFGIMIFLKIKLNPISLVNLIMLTVTSVEYVIHFGRKYLKATSCIPICNIKIQCIYKRNVGRLFLSLTLTQLISSAILGFTHSQIFKIYFFQMLIFGVVSATLHGLILFPILISIFGPNRPVNSILRFKDKLQRALSIGSNK